MDDRNLQHLLLASGSITKCNGEGCPLRNRCYRYLATSNPYYQSYFAIVPYHAPTGKCAYFWEINNENS